MVEIRTIKSNNLNCGDCDTTNTLALGVATSTQSVILIADIHGVQVFNIFGETTGTSFKINSISNRSTRYAFSSKESLKSLLSFLNIVNNNDGWAYTFAS